MTDFTVYQYVNKYIFTFFKSLEMLHNKIKRKNDKLFSKANIVAGEKNSKIDEILRE